MRVATSVVLLSASITTSVASAQDVDVTFSCPPFDGVDGNDPSVGALDQPSPIVVPGVPVCAVYIGNNTGDTIGALDIEVTFPIVDAEVVSESLLPDGIPGVTTSSPPFLHTKRFASGVDAVAGYPAPTSFDEESQVATWTLTDIAPGTAELRFRLANDYHWSHFDLNFPAGVHHAELRATADGTPIPGVRRVPIETADRRPRKWSWVPPAVGVDRQMMGFWGVGRLEHANYANSWFPLQTNAQVKIYLPYWDGAAFRADDRFASTPGAIPAIDPATFDAEWVRRSSAGYGIGSIPHELVRFDPVTTGGSSPWAGPAAGDNIHRKLVYDPRSNTLTGTFGALGVGSTHNGRPLDEDIHFTAMRWRSSLNPQVASHVVAPMNLPYTGCAVSDQAIAELGHEPIPGVDTDWCATSQLRMRDVEPLVWTYRDAGNGYRESSAYAPGSRGVTQIGCTNQNTLSRDVSYAMQLPGADERVADFIEARIIDYAFLDPGSRSAVRIFVSTVDSDYGSQAALHDRVVPNPSADWRECVADTEDGSVTCNAAALSAIGLTPADVREVRFDIEGQEPYALGMADARRGCAIDMTWALHPTVGSSINESGECAPPGATDVFDPEDMTLAAFGSTATVVSTWSTGETETDTLSWNGEVSTASKVGWCGAAGTTHSVDAPRGWSCGYGSVRDAVMGEARSLVSYFVNTGTLANVHGEYEQCATLPVGFVLSHSADPDDPTKPYVSGGSNWNYNQYGTALPPDRYTHTWDPDTRELCVRIPGSGDPDWIDVLEGLEYFNITIRGFIVPGAARAMRATNVTQTYYGEDQCGVDDLRTLSRPNAGGWNLALSPEIVIDGTVDHPEIGPFTEVCDTIEVDNAAYDADGTLVNSNAGSARDAVVYQPIPRTGDHPVDNGNVQAIFTGADSLDATRIWITTADLDPADLLDASALDPDNTAPGVDFVICSEGEPCDAEAAALALGTPDLFEVRWVAFEFGEVVVTDAEPRGVAPINGATRVDNPYTATLCLADHGSPGGATLRRVTQFRSSDTAPASSATSAYDVVINDLCADGTFPIAEICDGLDNDCDGGVDDPWPTLSDACEVGQGECRATGHLVCNADQDGVVCDAVEGAATDEVCDGLDNDCDGTTDDPWEELGAVCAVGLGECRKEGSWICLDDGTGSVCDASPLPQSPEICDGLDNDCDGQDDNGFDVGAPCTVGVGVCAADGVMVCTGDATGTVCDATEGLARAEACDGEDGNCDGVVDGQIDPDTDVVYSACVDADGDGISDLTEHFVHHTDPENPDTDGDGVRDETELGYTAPEDEAFLTAAFTPDQDPDSTTDPLDADVDDDGLLDGSEDADGDGAVADAETDPQVWDTDGDGLSDGLESGLADPESETDTDPDRFQGDADPDSTTDPLLDDTDGDGLTDDQEDRDLSGSVGAGETDPSDDDTDDDGLLDGTEDANKNGSVDEGETDPLDADSDDDLILDGTEASLTEPEGDDTDRGVFIADGDPQSSTDPTVADTDQGTTPDGTEDFDRDGAYEPADGECDPTDPSDDLFCVDSDDDGLADQVELDQGTSVDDDDTDDDGIPDGQELVLGLDPNNADTDGDGIQDGTELGLTAPEAEDTDTTVFVPDADPETTTDPSDADSDGDCLLDGDEDVDRDGAVDADETDPNDADSDDDGVTDGVESGNTTRPSGDDTCPVDEDATTTTDPLVPDSDDDGLLDGEEDVDGDGLVDPGETDPNDEDTDQGSVDDGTEVDRGTDPLDPADDVDEVEEVERYVAGGCGCDGSRVGWLGWPLALAGLAVARRRRRAPPRA